MARLDGRGWRAAVLERLDAVDWQRARTEVMQFLERPLEADMLGLDTFERLLGTG
ncbi:MAG: hypothetical protein ABFC80_05840 [Coriobacteriales bacterium]